jgi:hypothetical protein
MSKGELWKGVAIRLLTAAVFGVIGGFAIWYALQMVAIFGEGMGVDARSREIYAHSHMVVHIFGAACALAIGVFYQSRNWALFALALLAIITCGSYGILNMVGFTSTNRVAVAATKDAKRAAAERQYQSARTDLTSQIDWLQKTAASEEGRERRRLLAEVDAKRKELSALAPPSPTADTVLSDTQSTTLGELTGTSARKWLLALPVPLAILIFFAESFSFVVVGHMLAATVAMFAGIGRKVSGNSEPSEGNRKPSEESKDKQSETVVQFPGKTATADQFPAAENERSKVSSEMPRVPALAPTVSTSPKLYGETVSSALRMQPEWPSQQAIADALGVTKGKVSKDIKKLKGQRKLETKKNGKSNAVIARRQGVLHAVI